MLARVKHLVDWMLVAAFGPSAFRARDPRRDEQMAAMHTYPTTGRSVMGAPKKRPAAAGTAPATSQGDEILEHATD